MAGIQQLLLESLQGSAKAENAAMDQQDALTSILKEMGILNRTSSGAIDKEVAAVNTVEQTAMQGEQAAQDAARTFARNAGTLIGTPESVLVELGQKLNQYSAGAQSAAESLEEKKNRPILDNPLAWLEGQITMQRDADMLQSNAKLADLTSKRIAQLTTATDEVGATQRALAQKITDGSRAAAADARIAQAEQEKATALRNHLKDEVAVVGAIQNSTAAQATEIQRRYNMVANAEQLDMERERFAFQKEQWNWEKQIKELNAKTKLEADSIKQKLLEQYNIGASQLGYPAAESWELLSARAELGGTAATQFSAAMESGLASMTAGGSRITNSAGGAAMLIGEKAYPRANDPAFARMSKYFKDRWDNAILGAGGKKDVAVGLANEVIKKDVEQFSRNMTATGSFYAPPPIASITATKSVQTSPLYRKVLSTAGKDLTTAAPSPILGITYEAYKKGIISLDEAISGLNEFYGQAVTINNVNNRYTQLGIPKQEGFKTKPDVLGVDNVTVDLTDYSSTARLFAIVRARETAVDPFKLNLLNNPLMPGASAVFGAQDTTKQEKE